MLIVAAYKDQGISKLHGAGIELNNHVSMCLQLSMQLIHDITHGDCEDVLANEDEQESRRGHKNSTDVKSL